MEGKKVSEGVDEQLMIATKAITQMIVFLPGELYGKPYPMPVVDASKIPSAIEFLRKKTGKGKEVDPFLMPDGNAWVQVCEYLKRINEYDFALLFILNYLDLCYELQLKAEERIHKGAAHFWASHYYQINDMDELAISHMLLAFVEDAIQFDDPKGAPAWNLLTTRLRFSSTHLDMLLEYLKSGAKRERMMLFFPEYALLRYIVDLRRRVPWLQMPFNRLFLREQCKLLTTGPPDPSGKRLELLMVYLFRIIPNLAVEWRSLTRAGEFDIVVANSAPLHEPARWFGDYVLVECKDTNTKVGTKELEAFFTKLTVTKITTGILVSRKGLSGSNELNRARGLKHTLFASSSIVILDLSLLDICRVDSPTDFVQLLTSRYEDVRFGRLRQTIPKKK